METFHLLPERKQETSLIGFLKYGYARGLARARALPFRSAHTFSLPWPVEHQRLPSCLLPLLFPAYPLPFRFSLNLEAAGPL
jgi:hypothetical protein